jgi:hypothetical protein
MADAKPSLTPHRDATEKNIAALGPAENFIEAIANDVTVALHRAIADQRDAGVTQRELLRHLPKIVRAVAINGLAAVGAPQPVENAASICLMAASPDAAPDELRIRVTEIDRRSMAGGRA